MEQKYRIEPGTDAHQVAQWLEDKIYAHNSTHLGRDDGRLFSYVVRDGNDTIIGGIGGWTWAQICEITQLWVDPSARKNGIGTLLLEAAEADAISRGCHTVLVRSYSFQAPRFYERHGYRVEHVLKGFPAGHDYYILTKRTA